MLKISKFVEVKKKGKMPLEKLIRLRIKDIKEAYKHVLTGDFSTIVENAPRALMQLQAETNIIRESLPLKTKAAKINSKEENEMITKYRCKRADCRAEWTQEHQHLIICPACGDLNGEPIREENNHIGSFLEHSKQFVEEELRKNYLESTNYQEIVQEQLLSIWKILEEHNIPKEEIFDVMKNLSFEIHKILIEEHQKKY